jgi:hypothetical protein
VKDFSETYGYKPIKTVQLDSIDDDLRVGLWNALAHFYFRDLTTEQSIHDVATSLAELIVRLWTDVLIAPIDSIPQSAPEAYAEIEQRFFSLEWYKVYDFVQYVAVEMEDKRFAGYCNYILERECSAWRLVGNKIAPVTSREEIAAIEEASGEPDSLRPVAIHLNSALDLMSDRESPDYRNSIKESISAVESMCTLVGGTKKAELTQALTAMKKKGIDLHPALQQAFVKLYAYASDADGIRHALLEEPDLYFEDAKFMLVACSTFINYIKLKSAKAGIKL